jgi:hypothetical protein
VFQTSNYLKEITMAENSNQYVRKSDAVFVGWRKDYSGTPLALFFITAVDHPSFGSTVTEDALREFGLQIPAIPPRQISFTSSAGQDIMRELHQPFPPMMPGQRGAK